uniref:Uncharacterized protein n=1 Tax=Amorphochlora amoebiformis TaxID=1561963 RepID=A0A7S0CWQ7_9EUKA
MAQILFMSFCMFEFAVGLYYASMCEMTKGFLADQERGNCSIITRLGMTALAIGLLWSSEDVNVIFLQCSIMLTATAAMQTILSATYPTKYPVSATKALGKGRKLGGEKNDEEKTSLINTNRV